jgi:colanic acid/amylovoran biosynthesis glycosyltransferase
LTISNSLAASEPSLARPTAATEDTDRVPDAAARQRIAVAYLLTHYPRVALTFISGEIDELERAGIEVFPIVMNAPADGEIGSEEARVRQSRSFYLKNGSARLVAATLATLMRHPIGMTRLVRTAVRTSGFDLSLLARRLAHLVYGTLAAQHCREHGIKHLHAHFGQAPASIAWFAAEILKLGEPRCASFSFTIHGFQDFVDEAVARLDVKAAAASFVACISDFTKSQLCRITAPEIWNRFHVIRCGIELTRFSYRAAPALGPDGRPRIIMVGRLSPEKGHLVAIQAVKRLCGGGIPVELEIVGGGPCEAMLRAEADRLGITELVSFSGELEGSAVIDRLRQSHIFCMASFAEGLPVSLMEAMALGVPVVSTWISGIPELARDGDTALLVPPGNDAELARALGRLIEDRELGARLAERARAAVEEQHDRGRNALELIKLLRSHL